jgi:hypothetical protein
MLFKAESRANSNRHLVKNLMFLIEEKSSSNFPTFLSESAAQVSEEILPTLW